MGYIGVEPHVKVIGGLSLEKRLKRKILPPPPITFTVEYIGVESHVKGIRGFKEKIQTTAQGKRSQYSIRKSNSGSLREVTAAKFESFITRPQRMTRHVRRFGTVFVRVSNTKTTVITIANHKI